MLIFMVDVGLPAHQLPHPWDRGPVTRLLIDVPFPMGALAQRTTGFLCAFPNVGSDVSEEFGSLLARLCGTSWDLGFSGYVISLWGHLAAHQQASYGWLWRSRS